MDLEGVIRSHPTKVRHVALCGSVSEFCLPQKSQTF